MTSRQLILDHGFGPGSVFGSLAQAVAAQLVRMRRAYETRKNIDYVSDLPDSMLRDLGISRYDIARIVRYGR